MSKPVSKQLVVRINNEGYPAPLRSGKSTYCFGIQLRRSTACCGSSTSPGMITSIQKCSSARLHCHSPSRRQCWPLLDRLPGGRLRYTKLRIWGQEIESPRAGHIVRAIDAKRADSVLRARPDFQTRRRLLSRAIDPVRPNEKVGWNFPCFTKLVDHVYRERASASENFGRTRARAQEFGKLALCVP